MEPHVLSLLVCFLFLISVYWSGCGGNCPALCWWVGDENMGVMQRGRGREGEREREREKGREGEREREGLFYAGKARFQCVPGRETTVNTTTMADWMLKAFLWPLQNSWSNLACKDHWGPWAFIIIHNLRKKCSRHVEVFYLGGVSRGKSNFILYYLFIAKRGKRKFITMNANIPFASCSSPIILINIPTLWTCRKSDFVVRWVGSLWWTFCVWKKKKKSLNKNNLQSPK